MDMSWEDVRLFLAVAEAGSVSGAARRLRLGQPTVSRRLSTLEDAVGELLFRRSVGGAALTTAGERLLEPAKRMAEWAGEVTRAADARHGGPQGLVRITAAPYVAADFVAPFAGWLKTRHPALRLEVLSTMLYLDLARGEADLALRPKAPTQPELMLVYAATLENAVFVAPQLAARLPKRPQWSDFPWIAWAPPWDQLPPNPQLEAAIPGFVPAFTSDNFLVNVAAAEAGLGAVVLSRSSHRLLRRRNLVPCKMDLGAFRQNTLHLVCAKSAYDIPRIRRVAQALERELAKV
jgi:DNA-binding transcriptional LysR family regulator